MSGKDRAKDEKIKERRVETKQRKHSAVATEVER